MEEKKTAVESLLEIVQSYTKTSIQLVKLKTTGKIAEIVSNLVSGIVILILLVLLFINLNIAIALIIGDLLDRIWLGFLILSGFYGITGLIAYLFRNRWIKKPVSNSVITLLLKEEQLNEDHLSEQ